MLSPAPLASRYTPQGWQGPNDIAPTAFFPYTLSAGNFRSVHAHETQEHACATATADHTGWNTGPEEEIYTLILYDLRFFFNQDGFGPHFD